MLHAGYVAVGAAALSAAADAADAAGGFSARGLADFLLYADAGLTRLAVVGLLGVALAVVAAGRRRVAVFPAVAAMLALAVSGHAPASAPRALAVLNDWLHLLSAALWAGGIAVLVLVWLPLLRGAPRSRRHAVARQVLPAFGRIALPAFVVVAVTGAVSAGIELGRVAALWQSDYGRVLMVKVGVVALIAAASAVHARRLRPRLLAEHEGPASRSERRHWRLLGLEPLLGVGVVAAVGVLVAFPLPPRQLDAADGAEAAVAAAVPACAPCPLPAPRRGELVVAEQAGSNVVAAWAHREGAALVGTVRVYGLSKRPRPGPLRIGGAVQRPCGTGCRRIRVARAPRTLTVTVSERGRPQTARLPVRWTAGRSRQARRLLDRAQPRCGPCGPWASIYAITMTGGGGSADAGLAADGSAPAVAVPAQRVTDIKRAASAAGCQLRSFKSFGQEHTTDKVTYETNPPTSGPHNPVPAADGAYPPDSPPRVGNAVHALEHGRVEIQWRPGLAVRRIGQLQSLFEEQAANHVLLFANQTGMPFAVAASAWRHSLGCRTFSPKVFDAIRTFRAAYTDKAPELVP